MLPICQNCKSLLWVKAQRECNLSGIWKLGISLLQGRATTLMSHDAWCGRSIPNKCLNNRSSGVAREVLEMFIPLVSNEQIWVCFLVPCTDWLTLSSSRIALVCCPTAFSPPQTEQGAKRAAHKERGFRQLPGAFTSPITAQLHPLPLPGASQGFESGLVGLEQ